MEKPIDLNGFIMALTESAHGGIVRACDGLTDEQLYRQPTEDTNSISWLIWHLSRVRDQLTSNISGESQVWSENGWAARFGLKAEDNGIGDTPETVAAFRIERSLLMGYLDDAHHATMRRISQMTSQQFDQPVEWITGGIRPAWQALVSMTGDSAQHNGQIAYLRGMYTGLGWR